MRNGLRSLALVGAIFSAVSASATTNLVVNGDFETGYKFSTEFNTSYYPSDGPTGWTSETFYAFNLYLDNTTATTVGARTQYGSDRQDLAPSFVASPTGGKFVALDGDSTNRGPLTQAITGLTTGLIYTVEFDWGASQLQNREGATTEQLLVGFGNASQLTAVVANPSQGFTGWFHEKFAFTADAPTQLLSFLSLGTPVGLPPIAVLDGVSVTEGGSLTTGGGATGTVPEPATWGLMLAGFALVGASVRRRRNIVLA
jgi:hypothetical protein